jgi:CHAT domain-containing protein
MRISPDGILWRVPWDAVIGEGPATPVLLHPSLGGGHSIGSLERVALWIDTPSDLPNTLAEEKTILERFPRANVFRSREEVLASLGQEWDLVHVAGHARHREGNPMFSALEFPDGPIYASEIARSGLRTRLACLSACETGTLSLSTRQEPDGLARAFLARGAEAVLASLWPLDDVAASIFFDALYNDLRPISNLPKAVSEARSAVRAWRDHPYFWAPLSLFGGYCS